LTKGIEQVGIGPFSKGIRAVGDKLDVFQQGSHRKKKTKDCAGVADVHSPRCRQPGLPGHTLYAGIHPGSFDRPRPGGTCAGGSAKRAGKLDMGPQSHKAPLKGG
jgi:hypothetical protein